MTSGFPPADETNFRADLVSPVGNGELSTMFFCVVVVIETIALVSDGSSVTVEGSFSLLSETVSANNVVSSVISFNAAMMAPCTISVTSSATSVVPSVVPSVDTLAAAASSAALATSSAALAAASAASFSRMALGLHGCF